MPRQQHSSLQAWLAWQEQSHSSEIELGLDRVKAVYDRMALSWANTTFITVAGTNGKGSTVAFLHEIYRHSGYTVGAYTSPHLLNYNERVAVNGEFASDSMLCAAFDAIDAARCDGNEISLTFFEFGVLAALYVFAEAELDVVLLEVGLGGRLDATNIIDAHCAIVTSIGIDHRDWLGDTREAIGAEKAGIFRADAICISGDEDTPESVSGYANTLGARYLERKSDFDISDGETGWLLSFNQQEIVLARPLFLNAPIQRSNAASAVMAVMALDSRLPVSLSAINNGIAHATIAGRMQCVSDNPMIFLDVAHNEDAANALVNTLQSRFPDSQLRIVLGMLQDKEVKTTIAVLNQLSPEWVAVTPNSPRALPKEDLLEFLGEGHVCELNDVKQYLMAHPHPLTVVTGSFFVVADVLAQFQK